MYSARKAYMVYSSDAMALVIYACALVMTVSGNYIKNVVLVWSLPYNFLSTKDNQQLAPTSFPGLFPMKLQLSPFLRENIQRKKTSVYF